MPHMSLIRTVVRAAPVCVLTGVAAVALLAWNLNSAGDGQSAAVAELRQRMETGGLTQESQSAEIASGSRRRSPSSKRLGSALVARQSIEDEARSSLKRLENVIAGSSTRGAAGEHILEEVLKHLPPEMLQRNVWVGARSSSWPFSCPAASCCRSTPNGSRAALSSSSPSLGSTPSVVHS